MSSDTDETDDLRGGPLSHITVLDLTRVRAGPTCVRQLGDWGAEVIKIEAPGGGADFSQRPGSDFQNLHRNKRGITLNLKSEEGVELLKRLVERADVLVENYRPDVKHRLGIDYETLRAVNPCLVYTSISGFGEDGPYARRPGVDQIVQGMGGLMSITGHPETGPTRVGIPVADLSAGILAAFGTLLALYERERSGKGQWVKASLLQAMAYMLDLQAVRWLVDGQVPGQAGNNHPTTAPMGTFRSRDGHINVAPTPAMWERFCRAMGLEDLLADPDLATNTGRAARREEINRRVEACTVERDSAYWVEKLNADGIPCGPINRIDEVFEDPQMRHLGVAQTVSSKKLGDLTLVGQPLHLSRSESALRSAAPEPGEHNDEILGELGLSAEDIAGLRDRGVV